MQEKEGGPYKLIDKKGRAVVRDFPARYLSNNPHASDLCPFRASNGLGGYVDLTGKVVVPPQYKYAGRMVS